MQIRPTCRLPGQATFLAHILQTFLYTESNYLHNHTHTGYPCTHQGQWQLSFHVCPFPHAYVLQVVEENTKLPRQIERKEGKRDLQETHSKNRELPIFHCFLLLLIPFLVPRKRHCHKHGQSCGGR